MVILTDKLVFNQQITFYQSECQNRSFYKVRFAEIMDLWRKIQNIQFNIKSLVCFCHLQKNRNIFPSTQYTPLRCLRITLGAFLWINRETWKLSIDYTFTLKYRSKDQTSLTSSCCQFGDSWRKYSIRNMRELIYFAIMVLIWITKWLDLNVILV